MEFRYRLLFFVIYAFLMAGVFFGVSWIVGLMSPAVQTASLIGIFVACAVALILERRR